MSQALQSLIKQAEAQKIQIQLSILLNKNQNLFRVKFPAIYKLFENHVAERFQLRLDPNFNINLVDVAERKFLYQGSPADICREQVDSFQEDGKLKRFRITKNEEYNDYHIHIRQLNTLIENYENDSAKRIEKNPGFIPNLILGGVGLGYHIPDLINRFDIHHILIYEKCLDTFHASLQTIDWEPILNYFHDAQRSITFCIGVEPQQALAQIEQSVNQIGLYSQIYSFVFRHTSRESEINFIRTYSDEVRAFLGGLGFYDDEQIGLAHAYHNLRSNSSVFISNKMHLRKTRLLIIGNGPSLDEHKDYILRNMNHNIVMSCGTALGSLLKMGIKPDFHVEMERTISMHDFIDYGTTDADRKDIILLCLHTVSPTTIQAFGESCYAIKANDAGGELIHQYYEDKSLNELPFCNPTVSNCALSFAVSMGFMDIHLIGVDLGVPEEGKHHAENSLHYEMQKHVEKNDSFGYNYKESSAIFHPGNFGGQVKTHSILNASRLAIERLLEIFKRKFPEFNCINSNNGVKIKHTESVRLSRLTDSKSGNKCNEINSIKNDHFYQYKNIEIENKKTNPLLKYFYSIKSDLKISNNICSEQALFCELNRVFSIVNKNTDKISHYLLRGSLNCFFGCIVENTLYCKEKNDFARRVSLGVQAFNKFIDDVYTQMEIDPFRVDDTHNLLLSKMLKKKEVQ